jgi:hypothetical protein
MENLVNIVHLEQLMKRILDHFVAPICISITCSPMSAPADGLPIPVNKPVDFKLGHYPGRDAID